MEAFEQRKQRELNRTFNKQVSTLRKEEKNKDVKNQIAEVSKLRKKRSHSQLKGSEDEDKSFNKLIDDDRGNTKSLKRMRMVSVNFRIFSTY